MKLRSVLGFNNIGTACLLQVSGNTDLDIALREVEARAGAKARAEAIEVGFLEQLNKPGTFGP